LGKEAIEELLCLEIFIRSIGDCRGLAAERCGKAPAQK
jgi:hypothetical protein